MCVCLLKLSPHTHRGFSYCVSVYKHHTCTHCCRIWAITWGYQDLFSFYLYKLKVKPSISHTQQPPAFITACVCVQIVDDIACMSASLCVWFIQYSNSGMMRVCVCRCPSSSVVPPAMMLTMVAQVVFFNNLIQQHNYQVSNCNASISGPDGLTVTLHFHTRSFFFPAKLQLNGHAKYSIKISSCFTLTWGGKCFCRLWNNAISM